MPGSRKLNLIWSPAARADLIRLREFIEPHNPEAARRAAEALKKAADLLLARLRLRPTSDVVLVQGMWRDKGPRSEPTGDVPLIM